MSTFSKNISIRWADLDPNFQLHHRVYCDLGSQFRIELLLMVLGWMLSIEN